MIPEVNEKSVGKVEDTINAIWGLLSRNWGKLIAMAFLTGLGYFVYLVVESIENESEPTEDEYYDEYQEDGYDDYEQYQKQ